MKRDEIIICVHARTISWIFLAYRVELCITQSGVQTSQIKKKKTVRKSPLQM